MPDFNLIPQEYQSEEKKIGWSFLNSPFFRKIFMSRIFMTLEKKAGFILFLSIIFLFFSITSAIGFWTYKNFVLIEQNKKLDEQIKQFQDQRDLVLEKELKNIDCAIIQLKNILENHVYPSEVFKLLEQTTISQVQFLSFSGNLKDNKISLAGLAERLSVLAQQSDILKKNKNIKEESVLMTNINRNSEGRITFNLSFELASGFLKKTQQ
jgi:hypothetical protein